MVFARELALLELLAGTAGSQGTSLGVSRAATLAQMSKAQASRTFASLEAEGLVVRDPQTREYRLGWRLPGLLIDSRPQRTLQFVQERINRLLTNTSGVGASFGVLRGDKVQVVYSAGPNGSHRKIAWDRREFPATRTANGRVLLAALSEAELSEALAARPSRPTRVSTRQPSSARANLATQSLTASTTPTSSALPHSSGAKTAASSAHSRCKVHAPAGRSKSEHKSSRTSPRRSHAPPTSSRTTSAGNAHLSANR